MSRRRNIVQLVRAVALCGVWSVAAGCSSAEGPPHLQPVPDAALEPDSAPSTGDLGSPAADAGHAPPPLACPPVPERFVPAPFVPSVAHQGRCSPAEISAFVSACVSPGLTCDAWSYVNHPGFVDGSVGSPCGACIFEPKNNGVAWVDPDDLFIPNFGGCIQILDPVFGPACAQEVDDLNGCQALACEYCPSFSSHDYDECIKVTAAGACAPYLSAATTACQMAADAYLTCTASAGAAPNWVYIATLLCGAAGADAAAD